MFKYVKVTVFFLSTMFTSFGVMSLKRRKNVYSNMSWSSIKIKRCFTSAERNAFYRYYFLQRYVEWLIVRIRKH